MGTQQLNRKTTTLFEALPDTKFIFPCARRQRATVYKRSIVRQWFDDWHLDPELSSDMVNTRYDDGLQTTGLGESFQYLRVLIAEEAELVGSSRNVVLGGFSQGAATSLITAILWDGNETLGGVVSMSGWLPYMKQMTGLLKQPSDRSGHFDDRNVPHEMHVFADADDPFERPAHQERTKRHVGDCRPEQVDHPVFDWLREEIELPNNRQWCLCPLDGNRIPTLLCHGALDDQVSTQRSQEASFALAKLGLFPFSWKYYDGVDHDYSATMLCDVMLFLQSVFSNPANLSAGS